MEGAITYFYDYSHVQPFLLALSNLSPFQQSTLVLALERFTKRRTSGLI